MLMNDCGWHSTVRALVALYTLMLVLFRFYEHGAFVGCVCVCVCPQIQHE